MKIPQFVESPGQIFDLLILFILYFNPDQRMPQFGNPQKAYEDSAHFKKMLTGIEFSEDLQLFFYLGERKKTFISLYYFDNLMGPNYTLSTLLAALMDCQRVASDLTAFYFPDAAEVADNPSITNIGPLIKASDYESGLKNSLYGFFLDPVPVIQQLSLELLEKYQYIRQIHQNRQNDLFQTQQQINKEISLNKFVYCDAPIDFKYVSFCLVNKNCIKFTPVSDEAVLIIGFDYVDSWNYYSNKRLLPELDIFCAALSEKNRVEILKMLHHGKEITIRDIEQRLGLTGTNAYYHLSLMMKAGLIVSRNDGRTVLYRLNPPVFDAMAAILKEYGEEKNGI